MVGFVRSPRTGLVYPVLIVQDPLDPDSLRKRERLTALNHQFKALLIQFAPRLIRIFSQVAQIRKKSRRLPDK